MFWENKAEKWFSFDKLDPELKELLIKIKEDKKELEDRFYRNLDFGTGGMRGEFGPGTNRMNIYTIRKAAEGLARYMKDQGNDAISRGTMIAYDSRHQSNEFALEVAKTLGHHGIKVYLFDNLRPTPELSFAVRFLKAFIGVVITASHNPANYNGLKLYGEDGGQITPDVAKSVIRYVNEAEDELSIEVANEQEMLKNGLLTYIGESIDAAYLEQLKRVQINRELVVKAGKELKIVFTPLHGTANVLMRAGLKKFGFENVTIVKEQELPDPNFSTVKSPNPEEHAALQLAIKYGHKIDADILMGTDPDADRLGVAVKNHDNEYVVLTGNQLGALMLHYLLTQKKEQGILPENGAVIKTIVTSEMGRTIASDFGVRTIDTLTGFKYIGKKINEFHQTGQYSFLFGYEESYGYLIGDFVRDKDAIQAGLFICEVAAFYKSQGRSLYDGLIDLWEKYGYFQENLQSITFKGKEGVEKIESIMQYFRNMNTGEVQGLKIVAIEDYLTGMRSKMDMSKDILALPKSNVIKIFLEDGSWFCVRPSGTEPKIKFYAGVKSSLLAECREKLLLINQFVKHVLNTML